ncbi:MAG: LuxR C-terminal-related transcriptional regulator [Treponema sp.]|jgi:LuxR family maltose regulon positive regulatory protein|nr:LuxR C-terminal-related transcriptional regulator [Treponema sp.]
MPERLFYSNVPVLPENQVYLERPQVYDLLEKAVKSPVVMVTAGAGYGKTQAVYSFVRKYNAVTVWLQLFERDNLGWRFWENFSRAFEFINRDFAEKLRKTDFPDTEQKFEQYLRIPNNDIDAVRKYIFVYDDFHLIHDPSVLRFIEHTVTTAFPNTSFILISRTEPGINTVPLLSKGYLTRISQDDLRFTPDETREYFRIQGLNVQSDVYTNVHRDTDGWAFAIHLAFLSIKSALQSAEAPNIHSVASSVKRNIFKLMESEIFSVVSENLRKFLIKISLIDQKTTDILSKLASPEILDELGRIGSFVHYNPYLNTWRIHHLFLEHLQKKQGELSAEEKREVYITAAEWCAENNFKMDALSYFEKAGAYDKFLEIVYSLPQLLPNRLAKFLLEILDRAPESLFRETPQASIVRMRILIVLERFEEASAGLLDIINRLEAEAPGIYNKRILKDCYANLGLIGFVTCLHTRDYSYVRYFERSCHYYEVSGRADTGFQPVAPLSSYLCRVNSAKGGEIERYIRATAEMVSYVSRTNKGISYGMDDLAWAELAFFRNEREQAEQMAYQALYKAQEKNQYEIVSRAVFYLIRINLFKGNFEKIENLLVILEAQLEEPDYVNRYIYYDIHTGWFYSHIGQPDRLASWLKNDFVESDLSSLSFGLEVMVRGKYHYVRGDYRKAVWVIEKYKSKYGLSGFLFGKLAHLIMKAICLNALKDIPGAIRALEKAYALALPNRLDMPFLEQGKITQSLFIATLNYKDCSIPRDWLERMLRSSSAYAKKLYVVSERFRNRQYEDAVPPVFLSRRELLVFKGLSRGLTREELAKEENVSINTVKSIIKSVYNKLGAVNRADAVRIATSMGILKNSDPESDNYRHGKKFNTW